MLAQGLRQRGKRPHEYAAPLQNVVERARKFDIYSKVHDDYRVKTRTGGFISLMASSVSLFLILQAIVEYTTVEIVDHVMVNTKLYEKLPISINITFHHLRCDEISVDSVDAVNDVVFHAETGRMNKTDLGPNGVPSGGDYVVPEGECGTCHEASANAEKMNLRTMCCNTCDMLKKAYRAMAIPYYHMLAHADVCARNTGCQVHGSVNVSKWGGNLHVALGSSRLRSGRHAHEFNIKDAGDGFNTSHTIHRLRFGDKDVPSIDSILEGTSASENHGAYMFHYYIKLVPTLFVDQYGEETMTHQYSVAEKRQDTINAAGQISGLPGVYFVYSLNPFLVVKQEKTVPLNELLTSICAIIGGIFTLAGLLDKLLFSLNIFKKFQIPVYGRKAKNPLHSPSMERSREVKDTTD